MIKKNDKYKSTIIKLLKAQRRPLSTRKIAHKTDMTWNTAKSHLSSLTKRKKVYYKRYGNKTLWSVNPYKKKVKKSKY